LTESQVGKTGSNHFLVSNQPREATLPGSRSASKFSANMCVIIDQMALIKRRLPTKFLSYTGLRIPGLRILVT